MQSQDKLTLRASLAGLAMFAIMALAGVLPGQAHAQSYSNARVDGARAAQVQQQVRKGRVVDIEVTQIETAAGGDTRMLGAAFGGAVGALIAENAGTTYLGQIVGGLAGAAAGNKVAGEVGRSVTTASTLIIELDDGEVISVAQQNENPVGVGDRVYVIGNYDNVRVLKARNVASAKSPQ